MAVLDKSKSSVKWNVFLSRRVEKNKKSLPDPVRAALLALTKDISENGPVRGNWPNYSSLSGTKHHCHLKKRGRPTYVAVWEVIDNEVRIVEVTYAGTRENAPY